MKTVYNNRGDLFLALPFIFPFFNLSNIECVILIQCVILIVISIIVVCVYVQLFDFCIVDFFF